MAEVNLTAPIVSGTARNGQTLSTNPGTWDWDEANFDIDYDYQWMRCDAAGANCVEINGAQGSSYTLTPSDIGSTIRSRITADEIPINTTTLPWAPPTLGAGGVAVVNWNMTNANRQSSSLASGGGRDLLITSNEVLTGPVYQLHNWRNIVWIGGDINIGGVNDISAIALSSTGTVHLEGIYIHGDGISDAISNRGGSSNTIVQIQNCRVSVHNLGDPHEHADCFQIQGNSKINSLRFCRFTGVTDYQGFFLRLADSGSFLNGGDFRQVNFRRRNAGEDPDQAYIFIADEDPATGHGPGQPQIGNITMDDVWVETTHSGASSTLYPSWIWETALQNPPSGAFGNKEGLFKLTDGQGQYVRPSTTSDTVPSGGSASGQQAESAGWTGIIRLGVPPNGDYCPAGVPGLNYNSPGYV